jgi:hypothetical protein
MRMHEMNDNFVHALVRMRATHALHAGGQLQYILVDRELGPPRLSMSRYLSASWLALLLLLLLLLRTPLPSDATKAAGQSPPLGWST